MQDLSIISALCRAVVLSAIIAGSISCKPDSITHSRKYTIPEGGGIQMSPLQKLSITGDFDGDGKTDTLSQHCISRASGSEIDTAADPVQNDFETVANWFTSADANVYLKLNANDADTLNLGFARGLHCLINIGDNNRDGRDEIALVVDHIDVSVVNSCRIYARCDLSWSMLKSFPIRETDCNPGSGQSRPEFLTKMKTGWAFTSLENDSAAPAPLLVPECPG